MCNQFLDVECLPIVLSKPKSRNEYKEVNNRVVKNDQLEGEIICSLSFHKRISLLEND